MRNGLFRDRQRGRRGLAKHGNKEGPQSQTCWAKSLWREHSIMCLRGRVGTSRSQLAAKGNLSPHNSPKQDRHEFVSEEDNTCLVHCASTPTGSDQVHEACHRAAHNDLVDERKVDLC